jgi:hypothetical protein
MPEQIAAAEKERTKQARMWSKAMVTIAATIGAALGGFITYATTPKALTIEDVQAAIAQTIANEMQPLRNEIASVRMTAEFARSDSEWVKKKLDIEIKDMAREVVQIGKTVAALDERTKKGGT